MIVVGEWGGGAPAWSGGCVVEPVEFRILGRGLSKALVIEGEKITM